MWTIVSRDDFEKFISEHRKLEEHGQYIRLYENENHIILPRQFYYTYPSQYLTLRKNNNFNLHQVEFDFVKSLRSEQQELADIILSIYKQRKSVNGIIQARPGLGKTVLAIYLASVLKYRTIFIVDNITLAKQWINEILTFTNLTMDDIGHIYSTEKFETDKKVYIGLVQTFNSKIKNNIKEFYNTISSLGFGLVVFDECHKTSAGIEYAKTSLVFDTPNILGLSATPYANDLHGILLYNTIGPIIARNKKYELIPTIYFYHYKSNISSSELKTINYISANDSKIAKSKYNNAIANDPNYLESIYNIVKDIRLDQENDRRIIIIAFTEKQLLSIQKYLSSKNIECKLFYSKQTQIDKNNDKLLIATYAYASHGFDYKELSDIILACPLEGKKSLIQCIGRILRSCSNKNIANVYDLVDVNVPFMFMKKIPMKVKLLRDEFGNCLVRNIGHVDLE